LEKSWQIMFGNKQFYQGLDHKNICQLLRTAGATNSASESKKHGCPKT